MSEDTIQPNDDIDHDVLFTDGAYTRLANGIVSIIFYLDRHFPKHGAVGSLKFVRKRREILHEMRMPIESGKSMTFQLVSAIYLAERDSSPFVTSDTSEQDVGEAILRGLDKVSHGFFSDTNKRIVPYNMRVFDAAFSMSAEGQKKFLEILHKSLDEKKVEVEALKRDYPNNLRMQKHEQ
ncbi:MAG: hypothetical protein ACREBU_07125 [Nitrososphaera sp.]